MKRTLLAALVGEEKMNTPKAILIGFALVAAAAKVWEKALEINPHMAGIRHRMEEIRSGSKAKPI